MSGYTRYNRMGALAARVSRALEQQMTNMLALGDLSDFDEVYAARQAVNEWCDNPVYGLAPYPPKLEPVPDPYEIWCKEVWGVNYELGDRDG